MNVVSPVQAAVAAGGGLDVVPVILSGGSGTRLWPVSRESFPKQFWPLLSERSMIEDTARRASGEGFAPPIVVCNQEHRFLAAEQLRLAGLGGARIVLEPVGRNSAPAIAAAALLVAEATPEAVLWMMAADAAITDVPALHRLLATAVQAARAGLIVTFGMRPSAPETGYGYIEVGEPLAGLPGVHALARFIEKPDAATAAALVASGRHLWNSGMFVFTAASLLAEAGAACAGGAGGGAAGGVGAGGGPGFHPPGGRAVPRLPQHQPGLRGGRAHRPRGGGAGRSRLVGRGQLGGAVGAGAQG